MSKLPHYTNGPELCFWHSRNEASTTHELVVYIYTQAHTKQAVHYFRKGSYLPIGNSDLWIANSTNIYTQEIF